MKLNHNVAVIPGDLNGVTVTNAVREVNTAVNEKALRKVYFNNFHYDVDYFLREGITELGPKELDELGRYDAIFLGAVGDPTKIKPGVMEKGLLLKIRQAFDLGVNLRPIILPEGVKSPIVGKGPEDINFEVCRENTEGLYVGVGWIERTETEDEVGYQIMKCSYKAVKRLAEFAANRALTRKEKRSNRTPRLHFVFKTNVLDYAGAPWTRVYEEFKNVRGDLDVRYLHIDNFVMQMIQDPEQFDVVVTSNMFGDIATDAGAVLQGGIGSAVSGNISLTGEYPSMFEPIHGSAPDKWYDVDGKYNPRLVQSIKPEAAFLSYAMMLEHLGERKSTDLVRDAALSNIRDNNYHNVPLDILVEQVCAFVRREGT